MRPVITLILKPDKDATKKKITGQIYRFTDIYILTIKLGKYGLELLDHTIVWVGNCIPTLSKSFSWLCVREVGRKSKKL